MTIQGSFSLSHLRALFSQLFSMAWMDFLESWTRYW